MSKPDPTSAPRRPSEATLRAVIRELAAVYAESPSKTSIEETREYIERTVRVVVD